MNYRTGGGRRPRFLPVAIWLLAVVALAGLLKWGVGNPQHPRVKSKETAVQHTAPLHRPAPSVSTQSPPTSDSPAKVPAESAAPREGVAPRGGPGGDSRKRTIPEQPASSDVPSHVEKKQSLSLASNLPPPKPERPSPSVPDLTAPVARIAIVIDDFGKSLDTARKFLDIPLPITFSVLPYQEHSREISRMASSHGHEVIVHLPMEPKGYPRVNPGAGALLLSMSTEKLQSSLQAILDSNPYAVGVNNHMGSSFAERPDAMEIVITETKRRGLYYLDSYTTAESVGLSLAQKMQMRTGRRDVFLDHVSSERYVSSQIDQLIRKAKIQGSAVAIGHPHDNTLQVLRQAADRFRKERVAVVPLGTLMTSKD